MLYKILSQVFLFYSNKQLFSFEKGGIVHAEISQLRLALKCKYTLITLRKFAVSSNWVKGFH